MMRVLFLNLPHRDKIMRRYMCSYNSPVFLFPPYELLQLAAAAREWNGAEVHFLDAIAEGTSQAEAAEHIQMVRPDLVVALTGIESIESDLAVLDFLKARAPATTFAVFGYYPTIYPEEILRRSRVDLILRNEPEESFSAYLAARVAGGDYAGLPGLAFRRDDGTVAISPERRITDLDRLPFPDYALIDRAKYSEMLLGGPLGVIQSARGCPFACACCITTHGRRTVYRGADRVVAEMRHLAAAGIKVVRFIDDTFNVDRERVQRICAGLIAADTGVRWSCLSRIDTLDAETLALMKRAGCVRVYIGVESYSQRVIDYLQKGYDCGEINARLQLVRQAGLESVGFILVGSPGETREDFALNIRGLLQSPLDFIIATKLVPYPGTPLFAKERANITFNLLPYASSFTHALPDAEVIAWEKELYRKFYLRPAQLLRLARCMARAPRQSLKLGLSFLAFLCRPRPDREHPDFL